MLRFLHLVVVVLCVTLRAEAQLGFDEEVYPKIFKVHGNVKQVEERSYSPDSFADTMGMGTAVGKGTLYFDQLGRMIKRVGKDVKYNRGPDEEECYTYYGADSVVQSPCGRATEANTIKTVNSYDHENRLVKQEFYTNHKPVGTVFNIYDSHGYLVKQVHKGEPGQEDIETYYVNDSRGNHLQILPPSVNQSIQSKRTITYNDHDDVILVVDYPHTTGTYRAFWYVYDSHGNWIKMTEYTDNPKCHASRVSFRDISYY